MNYNKKLSENKSLEVETFKDDELQDYFKITIGWSRSGDHAGFTFYLCFLKWNFSFRIYDHRHWNYETDRFYTKEELDYEYEGPNDKS